MPAQTTNTLEAKAPWTPIPGSSQKLALDSRCDITLYHGARGPGKTDVQLQKFSSLVGKGYGRFWRGVIFDREYKMLNDIVSKSKRWFSGYNDGAQFLSSTSDYLWRWPDGEELLFRAAAKIADYDNYHGQEFPFIGWNELCKYPTPDLFDMMMSCNRSSFTPAKDNPDLPPIPLWTFATTNPYGSGHTWVKRRFIDPAPSGRVVRISTKVFNPQTQAEEIIVKSQVAIFGSYRENIYLDPKYVATLENEKDPNRRKAWLEGDWNVTAGGALDDIWRNDVHVLPRFVVPEGWRLDRSFDWGSSHPASCIWWAEADGTEAELPDGTKFCPKAGTLIAVSELYVHDADKINTGLKWSATKVAQAIRDHEQAMMIAGFFKRQPYPGPADNQVRNVIMSDIDTIEVQMGKVGVRWTESDKSPGSRINGLQLVRDRLQASVDFAETGEAVAPGLYVMDNCRNVIATVPILPRDEVRIDDVDTEAEDHLYDCIRYRVLAGANRYVTAFHFKFPT